MENIRLVYGVPAKRGGRVRYCDALGTITGSRNGRLLIRLDGDKNSRSFHPKWNIEFIVA